MYARMRELRPHPEVFLRGRTKAFENTHLAVSVRGRAAEAGAHRGQGVVHTSRRGLPKQTKTLVSARSLSRLLSVS